MRTGAEVHAGARRQPAPGRRDRAGQLPSGAGGGVGELSSVARWRPTCTASHRPSRRVRRCAHTLPLVLSASEGSADRGSLCREFHVGFSRVRPHCDRAFPRADAPSDRQMVVEEKRGKAHALPLQTENQKVDPGALKRGYAGHAVGRRASRAFDASSGPTWGTASVPRRSSFDLEAERIRRRLGATRSLFDCAQLE